ncbi:MAG: flavodoxin domain-containing protein [Anaerolineae bacterium]|nr:flavodoxin domain-containing protein [Anaerolineae bacterium]
MKAAVLYWSKTGNTKKVACAIKTGLELAGCAVTLCPIDEQTDIDFYAYDLLCLGFPSYQWSPPAPVTDFLRRKFAEYRTYVQVGAPPRPGKHALIFCTYSGQHTGLNEAVPAGQFAGQFFEHLGIPVIDAWYVIGEYHGSLTASTEGRLGDIRGQPSDEILQEISEKTQALSNSLGTT